ncbi:MAG: hypothetical protein QG567_2046 [Campylobacterota bacterium]|nr:hypothetical protein [Campylobacterota bacterium]
MASELKQVSCYLNEKLKYAIEKEVIHFKYRGIEERGTINKNMSYIIEDFIDNHKKNTEAIADVIVKVLSIDNFDSVSQRRLLETLDISLKSYPLKLSTAFSKKLEDFRVDCNRVFGFKFTKTGFYNLILLHYYIENKVALAKMDLEFWSQDYFKRSESNGEFGDVLKLFHKLLEKGEAK